MQPTLIRDIHCRTKCAAVYSIVSRTSGIPSHMLTLSNGIQILRPNNQLNNYIISPVSPSHGITLLCSVKTLGGGSGDEFGEFFLIIIVLVSNKLAILYYKVVNSEVIIIIQA